MLFYFQPGHIKPKCAERLKKKNQNNVVNQLGKGVNLGNCFKSYLKKALINGVERIKEQEGEGGI